jgi:hypothetical protein
MANNFKDNLISSGKSKLITGLTDNISGIGKNKKPKEKVLKAGLQNFIHHINTQNGIFRPTCFEVQFTTAGNYDLRNFSIICHQAAIPGINVETTKGEIYALPYEIPIGVSYAPFWCTFYIDNEFQIPNTLQQLISRRVDIPQGGQNGTVSNFSPMYRDDSNLNLEVNIIMFSTDSDSMNSTGPSGWGKGASTAKLTLDNMPTISYYSLKNAFIKSIQETPLSWESQNQLASVTVEISYEWFESRAMNEIKNVATQLDPATPPVNLASILANNPILGTVYNAGKRTILNSNNGLMSSPLGNQVSQFL